MKRALTSAGRALAAGLLIVVPVYLAILLLVKGMASVAGLVKPVAVLIPGSWPAEPVLALLLILVVCMLVGMAVRTAAGRAIRERGETTLFERIPGYALIRSLTQQVAGQSADKAGKPALGEFDDGMVPAFVIAECDEARVVVFVPSIPTPLAGAVWVLERRRVHPVDVPFTAALRVVSHWGSGARDLVAAMDRNAPSEARAGLG